MHFACDDTDLIIYRGRPPEKARAEFARKVHNGLKRMRSRVLTTSCDMFCFSTHGEMDYLTALNGIPSSTIDE